MIFWCQIADSPLQLKGGILRAGNGFCHVAEWAAGTATVRPKIIPDSRQPLQFGGDDVKIITLALIALMSATCTAVQAQAIKELDLPAVSNPRERSRSAPEVRPYPGAEGQSTNAMGPW